MKKILNILNRYQIEFLGIMVPYAMAIITYFAGESWISIGVYMIMGTVILVCSFRVNYRRYDAWWIKRKYPYADKKINVQHLDILDKMNIKYGMTDYERRLINIDYNSAMHYVTLRFPTPEDLMAAKIAVLGDD